MNTLIDTHCHITCDALYERIDEVLENARQAGIEKMLIICTDFTEYERAQQLKEREPERFDIALGFHPNDLYAFQEADYERENVPQGSWPCLAHSAQSRLLPYRWHAC